MNEETQSIAVFSKQDTYIVCFFFLMKSYVLSNVISQFVCICHYMFTRVIFQSYKGQICLIYQNENYIKFIAMH